MSLATTSTAMSIADLFLANKNIVAIIVVVYDSFFSLKLPAKVCYFIASQRMWVYHFGFMKTNRVQWECARGKFNDDCNLSPVLLH